MACGPPRSMVDRSPAATRWTASSQLTVRNDSGPAPLRPTRTIGWGSRAGPLTTSRYPLTFPDSAPRRDRVVAVAGDGHRPAVLDRQLPRTGVRAVQGTGTQMRGTAHVRMVRRGDPAPRQRGSSDGCHGVHAAAVAPCRRAPWGGTLWMKEA